MKIKIVFLMVCWLAIAPSYAEWMIPPGTTTGNIGLMAWGWGWCPRIEAPSGKYINGLRFVYLSGTKRVGIRFMNQNAGYNNWSDESVLINEKWFEPVTEGTLYTVMSDSPCANLLISNNDWGGGTNVYVEVDIRDYVAEMPAISPPGGIVPPGQAVTITSSQTPDGASVFFTLDGSEPTSDSIPYADGLIVIEADTAVKAVAFYKGLVSPVNTKTFQIGWNPPEIFPPSGEFLAGEEIEATITNSPANNGQGTILFRYIYGGTQSAWTEYTEPISVTETSTVEAKAAGADRESSTVSETYEFVLEKVTTPEISPAGGFFAELPAVEISCATQDAAIHYTVNGAEPSNSSSIYSGPLILTGSSRVKAFAAKTGMGDSDKVSRAYILDEPLPQGNGNYEDYEDYLDARNSLHDRYLATQDEWALDDVIGLDDSWKNTSGGGGTGGGTGTGDGGGTGGGNGGGGGTTGGGTGDGTGDGTGTGNSGTGDTGGSSGGSTSVANEGDSSCYSTSNTYNSYDSGSGGTDYLGLGAVGVLGILPFMMKQDSVPSMYDVRESGEEKVEEADSKIIHFTR